MNLITWLSNSPPRLNILGLFLTANWVSSLIQKKLSKKFIRLLLISRETASFYPQNIAALWYVGLILPNLEYCAPFLITTNNYIKKEFLKIENRCLKIIDFENSKDQTRRTINIPKLTLRFKYLYLLSFYKLVNNLVRIIDKELLRDRLNSDTRLAKNHGFRQSNDNFRFAMANFGAKKFNDLPNHIKQSQSLKSFKSAIRSHILTLRD